MPNARPASCQRVPRDRRRGERELPVAAAEEAAELRAGAEQVEIDVAQARQTAAGCEMFGSTMTPNANVRMRSLPARRGSVSAPAAASGFRPASGFRLRASGFRFRLRLRLPASGSGRDSESRPACRAASRRADASAAVRCAAKSGGIDVVAIEDQQPMNRRADARAFVGLADVGPRQQPAARGVAARTRRSARTR